MEEQYLTEKSETEMLYSTTSVPSIFKGIYQVSVTSEEPFTVILNGKTKRKARTLTVTHPKPLSIEDIAGMKRVGYLPTKDSDSPGLSASQILLEPQEGRFGIYGYEKLPELAELSNSIETGKSVHTLRDPRYVEVDGQKFINLDTVEVEKIRDGQVKLFRTK